MFVILSQAHPMRAMFKAMQFNRDIVLVTGSSKHQTIFNWNDWIVTGEKDKRWWRIFVHNQLIGKLNPLRFGVAFTQQVVA